jgi:hypothetical protein
MFKFPVFTASDDAEALMELAAVFRRQTMERCAWLCSMLSMTSILESRLIDWLYLVDWTFAMNVPSVNHPEIMWVPEEHGTI